MQDQIAILLELRQVDDRLHQVMRHAEARDADRQRRQMEVDLVRETLEREVAQLEEVGRQRRETQHEVERVRSENLLLEAKQHSVKTNVEYHAILKEIAATETRARMLEDHILELMETEEAAQRTRARVAEELEAKQTVLAEEDRRVAAELEAARREQADLEARRVTLVAKLAAPARSKYRRLRATKGDTAIVAVLDGSCGGCHYNLPPQTVNEVRAGRRLMLCEGCGRILVRAGE